MDTSNDDYQKVGKKIVCVFCYEENADEIDDFEEDEDNDYPDEEY